MLQKSNMSVSAEYTRHSHRWSENSSKLHDLRGEVAHVHQVQVAAQTVIGELQICPSAFTYLAVLSEPQ